MQRCRSYREDDAQLALASDGFHDGEGRRICFRGVNVAGNAKLSPFLPFKDPSWWDLLASWGFNMVRLTLFWEAVEPAPGKYDRSYLDKIESLVDQAAQRGLYILLDMHQDLYSRSLCGDGAPDWAFPRYVDPQRNDSFGGQFWSAAYTLSRDVRCCFTHFFLSEGLQEHYRLAWQEVAARFKGHPFILGYDIMNEPSRGDIPNDRGQFENFVLQPFYEEMISAIREVHPGAVGFVEPHIQNMYSSKLEPFSIRGLVYAPHLYDSLAVTLRFDLLPNDMLFCHLLEAHQEKARELSLPLFVGEFGAPWSMEPSGARNMAVDDALQSLEANFIDCAYWDYSVRDVNAWNEEDFSLIDEEGQPRGFEVNVRPYLARLEGQPISQSFNCRTKAFLVRFKSRPGLPPAVIRVPKVQYPQGFKLRLSDGQAEHHEEGGELWYYPAYDGCHQILLKPQ
jgi:endoglycosylceramidase